MVTAVQTASAPPPVAPPGAGRRGGRKSRNTELGLLLLAMAVVTGFAMVVEMQLFGRLTSGF